jgi:GNAT superfamily N-acetyltransferase
MTEIRTPILVTYMRATHPPPEQSNLPTGIEVIGPRMNADTYGELYRAIGAQVHWDSRLKMSRLELSALLESPDNKTFLLKERHQIIGLCEFAGLESQTVELTHFGLLPSAYGRGLGFKFLTHCLAQIWARGPKTIWLHTDEWDHPAAQKLYLRAGFSIFKTAMEDPEKL